MQSIQLISNEKDKICNMYKNENIKNDTIEITNITFPLRRLITSMNEKYRFYLDTSIVRYEYVIFKKN